MAYKLRNKNSVGMMASSPLYNTPKPDRAEYDSQEAYDQAMVAYDRSQTPAAPIPSETKDVRGDIKEKGTPVVKGAMQGSTGPNVQFGGDGRRIIKSGGGNVGAGSGTGGGKNQNIIGIPKDPYFGGSGVGSGLTSSFAGTAKLGTTFKPQPLVIPKAKTQDKKVKKTTTTTSTSSKSSTGPSKPVKKGPASTSTKPMEGLISLGGSEMVSKIKKTVDAARSSSNDLIKNNLDGGGRVGRVRRRQQKRTANLEKRLQNRAEIKGIRQSERGKRQGMRESASQERKNLLMDNPVAKDASGGRKSSQPSERQKLRQAKRATRKGEYAENAARDAGIDLDASTPGSTYNKLLGSRAYAKNKARQEGTTVRKSKKNFVEGYNESQEAANNPGRLKLSITGKMKQTTAKEPKMKGKTKRQLKRSNKFSESLSGAKNKNLKSGGSQDFRGMKGDKSSNKATFDYSGGKNKYKKNAKI